MSRSTTHCPRHTADVSVPMHPVASRAAQVLGLGLVLGLAAGAARAQEVEDANGDGVYSLEELRATFPDLSEADFLLLDTDGNAVIDAAELEAGAVAGIFGTL